MPATPLSTRNGKEFNDEVRLAIDSSVLTLVGEQVLKSVYAHIQKHYDVTADEVPYRLDTLFETLQKTFGVAGAKTVGRVIAKRFYSRMGLQFVNIPTFSLQDYLEEAKVLLLKEQYVTATQSQLRKKSTSPDD